MLRDQEDYELRNLEIFMDFTFYNYELEKMNFM